MSEPATASAVPATDRASDEAPEHGVGPWPGGEAAWPAGDHFDPELLREGDRRNVVDRYRYWRHEAIVADLDALRHPFHVAIENWQHDFNIGSVVRTANAFAARGVHIVGNRRWNRRGAMVTDRYQHVMHHSTVDEFVAWAHGEGLSVIGIDNLPGSVPLETFALPRECVLVFGQESVGLTEEVRRAADATLAIAQYGSTRSINAGAAAAIAMHAWVGQHGDIAAGHAG
ncbi:TrmH family RNA methyltransferase [Demequina sp. NBRC 110051]|uniref:TrmH family RNA methyltransferase n=1 Tax=Demequina sp. NBRC 110051 TaxID=1570340 RepID=UPI0009FEF425|nr:TrmH family RNA methyltransferase [Demequina sp. NBRC 110051]